MSFQRFIWVKSSEIGSIIAFSKKLFILALAPLFMALSASDGLAQSNDNSVLLAQNTEVAADSTAGAFANAAGEKELITLAGERSKKANIATVFVTKGPDGMEQFNGFKQAVIDKMATKGVPVEFFVDPVEQEGATFGYFINNQLHGPFNFEMFVAMLPEIVRDYQKEYPDADNRIGAASHDELNSKAPSLAKN